MVMKLCEGLHQIRVDFQVTPEIKRFAYIYLIEGAACYLVDSGVGGSEKAIFSYMEKIGRRPEEIRGIFLTHAHPDHIGSASVIRELTGCTVYASRGERRWIENIDLQFQERPIPNFHALAGASTQVDAVVTDGDVITPEPGMEIKVIGSRGHSCDGVSYWLRNREALFTGDAIPAWNDVPIYINRDWSMDTLHRLASLSPVRFYCPAWDKVYTGREGAEAISRALDLIEEIQRGVDAVMKDRPATDRAALISQICTKLGMERFLGNPLFAGTIASHLPSGMQDISSRES